MQVQIVNRLISARSLLENSGSRLNRHSDSRSVAHRVLTAHDAAELTIAALSEHLQTCLSDKATFTEILKAVNEKMAPNGLPGHNFLTRLNKVRVAFKHHGELPHSGSWFDVIETTTNHLNDACSTVFHVGLTEIDLIHLIENEKIRILLTESQSLRLKRKFKEVFETLSLALAEANHLDQAGPGIAPGDPDPQVALLLSGYGVDPSSFIGLQRFLPRVDVIEGDVKWNRRKTGHWLNWDDETATFCTNTVVQILLILQHAPPIPHAVNFYDVFRDLLTIKAEKPDVRKGTQLRLPYAEDEIFTTTTLIEGLAPGDKIHGRVCACSDCEGRFADEEILLEDAEWLLVTQPGCERLEIQEGDFLVVRAEHVTIGYEEDPDLMRATLLRTMRVPRHF